MDCVVRGGSVQTAERRVESDIGIRDGVVAQLGGVMDGRQEIDARGLVVLPGAVDPHVHLTCGDAGPNDLIWVDDFESGSHAALAGGVTTVGNMTFRREGETLQGAIEREAAWARERSIVDVFLHPIADRALRGFESELPRLVELGHTSLKLFMTTPSFDAELAAFLSLTRAAGAAGMRTLVHCEDLGTIQCCTATLLGGAGRSLTHFPESRPPLSEVVATQRAVAMCELTGSPIYVVHLSCERALVVCTEARARGLPVHVETRPLYLHLTRERYREADGAKYVAQPPLREASDVAALWRGLAERTIDCVATDHAPWTLAQKLDPSHDLAHLRPGVANLETMLPMLWSQGVRQGRITAERFVELVSTTPAQLFGLYPRKGTIAEGSDADLVLFDERASRRIGPADVRSRAGHSVYEGIEVTGWPTLVMRRGEVVYRDGVVCGRPGTGLIIPRAPVLPSAASPTGGVAARGAT
jgi:dihydropyrimidinase